MKIVAEIARALARGEAVALASVLAIEGSAPAPAGARLAVLAGGRRLGTIGGGTVEADVLARLQAGEEGLRRYELDPDAEEPGLLCGGAVEVLLERLGPVDRSAFETASLRLGRGEPVALGLAVAGGRRVARAVWPRPGGGEAGPLDELLAAALAEGRPRREEVGGERRFVELLRPTPRLIVIGAGHIGRRAARIAAAADLRVAVADDRPERLDDAALALAEHRLALLPAPALAALAPNPADAVLVATRSAELDLAAIEAALATPAFWIGLVGSRGKWERLRARLGPGAPAGRVRCPAGLALGGRDPGAIAVATVAEAIACWHGAAIAGRSG